MVLPNDKEHISRSNQYQYQLPWIHCYTCIVSRHNNSSSVLADSFELHDFYSLHWSALFAFIMMSMSYFLSELIQYQFLLEVISIHFMKALEFRCTLDILGCAFITIYFLCLRHSRVNMFHNSHFSFVSIFHHHAKNIIHHQ